MTKLVYMFKKTTSLALSALILIATNNPAESSVRLKDVVSIEGIRDNMLVGYGLVVGLQGSGDSMKNAPFTKQSLVGMLERMGVNTRSVYTFGTTATAATMDTKNIAAVMVTATLPPYAAQGTRIDVGVSSLGDATSLKGGTLLVSPLVGADGEVYAVAQGTVSSGFTTSGASGSSLTMGVPTAGRIAAGAIVEREIEFSLAELPVIRFSLHNPDFTTARRIAEAINHRLGSSVAQATDPATVLFTVPQGRRGDIVNVMTEIEQLRVEPDQLARVVVDEKTGVVVMGENVRVSTVAVAQGTLTVRVTETPQVSQPNAFTGNGNAAITNNSNSTATNLNNAGGVSTVTVQRSDVQADTGSDKHLVMVPNSVSLQELVNNLNTLGASPSDMISILQAIRAAGALQADIFTM